MIVEPMPRGAAERRYSVATAAGRGKVSFENEALEGERVARICRAFGAHSHDPEYHGLRGSEKKWGQTPLARQEVNEQNGLRCVPGV